MAGNPTGPPGNWTLTFEDTFDGTTLDTTKWVNLDGYSMNDVTARASNVSVSGGLLRLQLSTTSDGAYISTNRDSIVGQGFLLGPGTFTEARILFPGDGTQVYNWAAFWSAGGGYPADGSNNPANGENDIAEVLGAGVINNVYHGPSGQTGPYAISSSYLGGVFHVFGLHRKRTSSDFYYDGTLVRTIPTNDSGSGQSVLLNVGYASPTYGGKNLTGSSGAMQVDYVRAWSLTSRSTVAVTGTAPTTTPVTRATSTKAVQGSAPGSTRVTSTTAVVGTTPNPATHATSTTTVVGTSPNRTRATSTTTVTGTSPTTGTATIVGARYRLGTWRNLAAYRYRNGTWRPF